MFYGHNYRLDCGELSGGARHLQEAGARLYGGRCSLLHSKYVCRLWFDDHLKFRQY